MKKILHLFQRILTVIGSRISLRRLWEFQMIVNYLRLGRYYRDNGFKIKNRVNDQLDVFNTVIKKIQKKRVVYLEFGVYKGKTTQYWANKLTHPESIFFGFDSFEGLPEDFDIIGPIKKGKFNTGGKFPEISDKRVRFVKGRFEKVLPTFQSIPNLDELVIIMDADIYNSTIYVLRYLRKFIKVGTYIYFDDMSRVEHDPRAFKEFMEETGRKFELIAVDIRLNKVFFKCIE